MRAFQWIAVGVIAGCGRAGLQPVSMTDTTGGTGTASTGSTGTTSGGATSSGSTGASVVCRPGSIVTTTIADPDSEGLGVGSVSGPDGGLDLVVSAGNNVDDLYFFVGDAGSFTLALPILDLDAGPQGSVIPGPVLLADLNGDGLEDLVVCNFEDELWVSFNLGNGTFSAPDVYPTPCYWITTLDSSHSGRTDLAIAAGGSDILPDGGYLTTLTVLLNDGGGRFANSLSLNGYISQSGVAAGDLDGDGWTDLVTVGNDNVIGKVEVYLNNRDGGFDAPVEYAAASWAGADAVADFTGDGKPDVAVINYPGSGDPGVILYSNLGSGALQAGPVQSSNCSPEALAAADLNGDGRADLAVVGTGGLEIWLQADGGLQASSTIYDAGGYVVLAADLNGDGHADLAITGSRAVNSWLTVVLSTCE